jgi:hypothetical protein
MCWQTNLPQAHPEDLEEAIMRSRRKIIDIGPATAGTGSELAAHAA